jgi:acetoacetyl-CoA synthetase
MVPVVAGEISCRYLGAAVEAFDDAGRSVVGEQGELVITKPMPSMPVGFWGDADGSKFRAAYFESYPGAWRHGDWITIDDHGSCVITGRSDATLNRGGVRIGTNEIYRVVESINGVNDSLIVHLEDTEGGGAGVLVLFVALDDDVPFDDVVEPIKQSLRTNLSPRHVPDEIHQLRSIPTTLSGKKLELPVKKILLGADPDSVASRGSLRNPESLDAVAALANPR